MSVAEVRRALLHHEQKQQQQQIQSHGSEMFEQPLFHQHKSLTSLTLCGSLSFGFSSIRSYLALEILELNYLKGTSINEALRVLGSCEGISIQQTLRKLSLSFQSRDCNGNHLETLFFEILPRFPNLEELHLETLCFKAVPTVSDPERLPISPHATDYYNGAFKAVADRIRNDDHCEISKSLRHVCFKTIATNEEDLLTFLDTFVTVDRLSYRNNWKSKDMKDLLFFNLVGRRAWKGRDKRLESRNLPVSVWPLLLQRAQRKAVNGLEKGIDTDPYFQSDTEAMATGIYYLLREGPVLFSPTFISSSTTKY